MKIFLRVSLIATILIWSLYAASQSVANPKVQNIETFARLYGYARWFHPSDEAQEIDWDKFAVLGVQKVENVKSAEELRDTLFRLFSPIVQGLKIYKSNLPEKFNQVLLLSPDPNAKPVYWQHHGVYLNEHSNIYKSARVNKSEIDIYRDGAIICKTFRNPSHLYGKEVKFSGYFKNENPNKEGAKFYVQYIHQNENKIYDAFIESQDWKKLEITVTIPENSVMVAYGLWIVDNSEVSADDMEFLVNNAGKWEPADMVNMGFENGAIDENRIDDWKAMNMTYCTFEINDKGSHSGKYNLKLTFSGKMFDWIPQFGDIINEPIGSNLNCVVPLVLLTNEDATYPKTEISSLTRLKSEIDIINYGNDFNPHVNLASVVIAWNVLQHFFPYFDVIDTDWNKVLGETLTIALENKRKKDFFVTLSQMFAKINDGHGIVSGEQMYYLPVRTEFIENKIVITASNNAELKRGDIIKTIDGKQVMNVLDEAEKMISGSPQLRRHRALNILGNKFDSDKTHLVIERDGKEENVTVSNSRSGSMFFNPIDERKYLSEKIIEIEPEIYYINMTNCTENDFDRKLDILANAKAVIYDQRGGIRLNFTHIAPYLIDKPIFSAWWNIPQTVYPDRKEVEFNKTNWSIQPKQPLFKSKAVFINVPSVVSAGETMMGIIDHYNLAITVGEPTAGCNGNINTIILPCGYSALFTGMKVLKHDGSQLYIKGFHPDYPVNKTIQAIREGRDEYLEKALEIARGK